LRFAPHLPAFQQGPSQWDAGSVLRCRANGVSSTGDPVAAVAEMGVAETVGYDKNDIRLGPSTTAK
jgi:hypothetical protein